jgi:hypothetical protein
MVLRRLRWIDDRLHWHGVLRRSELARRFAISPQQASQDIALFQKLAPGRAVLDPSSKAYVRGDEAPSLFGKDAFGWIAEEQAEGVTPVLPLVKTAIPARQADWTIMAALLAAYEARQAVEIGYQSMSRAQPSRRTICPHHIVDTGDRYHVRAWDDLGRRFSDFVLGRILVTERRPGYPWVDAVADVSWNEEVDMVLAPAHGLSEAQRLVVEKDHGMEDGQLVFPVRKALIVYLAERLGVLEELQGVKPSRSDGARPLRCVNAAELMAFVPQQAQEEA